MEKHMSVAVGKPGTIYQSSQVARVSGYHWFVRKVETLRRAWLAQDWSKRGRGGGREMWIRNHNEHKFSPNDPSSQLRTPKL